MSHSSFLLLVFCGFLLSMAHPEACPARCECVPQIQSVLCHRKRLTSVPEGIPAETKVLELNKNRIRCLNPGELSSFSMLEDLDLSENIITHVEPGAFSNLFNLQTLRLRCNQLKLIPPGVFRKLTNLTLLDISENKIVILLDYMFQDLRNLKQLDVGDNDLVYISRKAFSGLVGLQELTIEKCNLTDLSAESLSHLQNLEVLRLRHFSITSVEDRNFRKLDRLRLLEIDSWSVLEDIAPKGFQGLNLTSLFITFTNLTTVPTTALRSQVHLVYLNLSYNPISTVPRGAFQELIRLKELHMAGALLVSVEPQALYGLRQMRLLNLSSNFLFTLEESTFHSVNTLETLRVDQNPLVCDCRLLWILQRRKTLNFDGQPPTCSSPLEIQGNALQDFPDSVLFEYFTCRKPQIKDRKLQHVTASEGQVVSFQCQAEGEPTPTISWVSPQHRVITSRSLGRATVLPSGTLEIRHTRAQDGGTYVCIASNTAGNDTYFATLTVQGRSVDGILDSNQTLSLGEFNGTSRNDSHAFLKFTLDLKTIFVSTAMGCITFLGVVLFCFLLLFLWSRGRGQHRNHFSVEYAFRKVDGPTAASGQGGSRKFNMKMI